MFFGFFFKPFIVYSADLVQGELENSHVHLSSRKASKNMSLAERQQSAARDTDAVLHKINICPWQKSCFQKWPRTDLLKLLWHFVCTESKFLSVFKQETRHFISKGKFKINKTWAAIWKSKYSVPGIAKGVFSTNWAILLNCAVKIFVPPEAFCLHVYFFSSGTQAVMLADVCVVLMKKWWGWYRRDKNTFMPVTSQKFFIAWKLQWPFKICCLL